MTGGRKRAKDVAIVGAGVIGLSLARDLAMEGMSVTVYDSKRHVSEGANRASGVLSLSGLERTGLPYRGAVVNSLSGVTMHAGNETLSVSSKETQALVIDREKLVEACMKEAWSAGAEIVLGGRMDRQEVKDLAKGRILVGADGAVSTVASAFKFPPIKEHILTYKASYSGAKVSDPVRVDVFFTGHAHRFFAWNIPYSSSELETGIGVSGFVRRNSAAAFKAFEERNSVLEGARMESCGASMIPLGHRSVTVKRNVALVGDAAGQVKATTGGGLIFGVSCARVLADSIIEHAQNGTSIASYEKEWRRRYAMDLRLHSVLHDYYSGLNVKRLETLFRLARALGIEGFLSRYGDMDRPSTMVKRFFLRGLAHEQTQESS